MNKNEEILLETLDEADKEKVFYFTKLLLKQSKYQFSKNEISERRKEIEKGETLEHKELWDNFDVKN